MATLSRGKTFGASETVTNTKLHDLVDLATITGIVAGEISAGAVGSTQLATDAVTAIKILALAVTTAKIDNLAVTTGKIADDAIDADKLGIITTKGDLISYSTEPLRVAIGADDEVITADAAEAAGWKWAAAAGGGALNQATGSFTRSTATASGTQAVTGVGFLPTAIIFLMTRPNENESSTGYTDGTTDLCILTPDTANVAGDWDSNTTKVIHNVQAAVTEYQGALSSFDADGFTIQWTRVGAPSGTIRIHYFALAVI